MKVRSLLVVCILLASVVVFQADLLKSEGLMATDFGNIESLFTEGIEDSGVVVRVRFRVLVRYDDMSRQWHYFGVTEAERPPERDYPVTEYGYVQFPGAFSDLPNEQGTYDQMIYQIAVASGLFREAIRTEE